MAVSVLNMNFYIGLHIKEEMSNRNGIRIYLRSSFVIY